MAIKKINLYQFTITLSSLLVNKPNKIIGNVTDTLDFSQNRTKDEKNVRLAYLSHQGAALNYRRILFCFH